MLHPATRLLSWLAFVIALPWLSWQWLLAVSFGLIVAAFRAPQAWRAVRRARWLLLVLFGVYALATPGTPLLVAWPEVSFEGVSAGGLQAWRLLLIMLALGVAVAGLRTDELMAGLYCMLLPLRVVGVDIDRFVVRLALTLRYAEEQPARASLQARFESAGNPGIAVAPSQVEFELGRFGRADAAFATVLLVMLAWALW